MKLNEVQLEKALRALIDWKYQQDRIEKEYVFSNFRDSLKFVNSIAESADGVGHHPDILISYSRVKISLTTHDEGGVTSRDLDLARIIDSVARSQI